MEIVLGIVLVDEDQAKRFCERPNRAFGFAEST